MVIFLLWPPSNTTIIILKKRLQRYRKKIKIKIQITRPWFRHMVLFFLQERSEYRVQLIWTMPVFRPFKKKMGFPRGFTHFLRIRFFVLSYSRVNFVIFRKSPLKKWHKKYSYHNIYYFFCSIKGFEEKYCVIKQIPMNWDWASGLTLGWKAKEMLCPQANLLEIKINRAVVYSILSKH